MFWTNPANTWPYQALQALEDRSIVKIVELLRNPLFQGKIATLRRMEDLVSHRTAVSHPFEMQWKKPGMQEFHDTNRRHLDVRAALLWDLNASINEQLAEEGAPPGNTDLGDETTRAMMLTLILRQSMVAGAAPDEVTAVGMLERFRPRFIEFITQNIPSAAAP